MKIRLFVSLLAVLTMMVFTASPAQAASGMDEKLRSGDIAEMTQLIQGKFSELMTPLTGPLDWDTIAGAPDSPQNIARMTELRAITPLAMVEGTAESLVKWMGTSSYTGQFMVGDASRGACVVGALTRGFVDTYTVTVVQDSLNALQALAYLQFDNHRSDMTVADARLALTGMTEWPIGAGGFDAGYWGSFPACMVMAATRSI